MALRGRSRGASTCRGGRRRRRRTARRARPRASSAASRSSRSHVVHVRREDLHPDAVHARRRGAVRCPAARARRDERRVDRARRPRRRRASASRARRRSSARAGPVTSAGRRRDGAGARGRARASTRRRRRARIGAAAPRARARPGSGRARPCGFALRAPASGQTRRPLGEHPREVERAVAERLAVEARRARRAQVPLRDPEPLARAGPALPPALRCSTTATAQPPSSSRSGVALLGRLEARVGARALARRRRSTARGRPSASRMRCGRACGSSGESVGVVGARPGERADEPPAARAARAAPSPRRRAARRPARSTPRRAARAARARRRAPVARVVRARPAWAHDRARPRRRAALAVADPRRQRRVGPRAAARPAQRAARRPRRAARDAARPHGGGCGRRRLEGGAPAGRLHA